MATVTAERTMLYCPKCQRKYEEGNQRFCNNDGGRLLPIVNSGIKNRNQTKGVFTNLLASDAERFKKDEQLAPKPKFVKKENIAPKLEPSVKDRVFKSEQILRPKTPQIPVKKVFQNQQTVTPKKNEPPKPNPRLVDPKELKSGQAELGDRTVNPTGRLALTWQNPRILLGQVIKGRYFITQKLEQDSTSIVYMARDKIRDDKFVVIRILMEQDASNAFQNKFLADERVSLSHIDHPNIAKFFDSGELPEGKPFIVTEYAENQSVKQHLKLKGAFNPQRTARIIRQASFALSEAHQNGILHRNLKPENILLTVSESGNEIVKVSDFCVSDGRLLPDSFIYKAPEIINGETPTYAGDGYSLAVVAYQMLTNRLPFNPATEREMLRSQKKGLTVQVTDLNPDINPLVDDIMSKALAFDPTARYPKARDFGEAFFNAITTESPWKESVELEQKPYQTEIIKEENKYPISTFSSDDVQENLSNKDFEIETAEDNFDISVEANDLSDEIHIDSYETENVEIDNEMVEEFEAEKSVSTPKDTLWEKRSPDPVRERSGLWILFSILGILMLIAGGVYFWRYLLNTKDVPTPGVAKNQALNKKEATIKDQETQNTNKAANAIDNLEIPPPEREVIPPKDFKFYENVRQNLSDDLAKNFRGFSLYYPQNWKVYKSESAYFDVKLEADDGGFPKQQFLVHRYESRGTFEMDKENFPALIEKSNKDLAKILPDYKVVSEGGITVNNGWKAYEVKFSGKSSEGEEVWGRRIWMPAARPFEKNGFVITMLATSVSEKIKSLDDIGKEGELGDILYTFEPSQSY